MVDAEDAVRRQQAVMRDERETLLESRCVAAYLFGRRVADVVGEEIRLVASRPGW